MLRNRSLNRLPSGYRRGYEREGRHPSYEEQLDGMLNSTHLEPAQTFTEFLAELHVDFPLAHDVLAKFLSRETALRKARFLLGPPFRGRLDSCRLRPVSSLA